MPTSQRKVRDLDWHGLGAHAVQDCSLLTQLYAWLQWLQFHNHASRQHSAVQLVDPCLTLLQASAVPLTPAVYLSLRCYVLWCKHLAVNDFHAPPCVCTYRVTGGQGLLWQPSITSQGGGSWPWRPCIGPLWRKRFCLWCLPAAVPLPQNPQPSACSSFLARCVMTFSFIMYTFVLACTLYVCIHKHHNYTIYS